MATPPVPERTGRAGDEAPPTVHRSPTLSDGPALPDGPATSDGPALPDAAAEPAASDGSPSRSPQDETSADDTASEAGGGRRAHFPVVERLSSAAETLSSAAETISSAAGTISTAAETRLTTAAETISAGRRRLQEATRTAAEAAAERASVRPSLRWRMRHQGGPASPSPSEGRHGAEADGDGEGALREPLPSAVREPSAAEVAADAADAAVPLDLTAAAFFDVDNTVMRGASIFYIALGLYQRKFFRISDVVGWSWQSLQYSLVGENLEHVEAIQADALAFVQGHSVAELRRVSEEIYDELMAEKVWPGTHHLALQHIEAGQRVWLVTASPIEMADVIARRLGLTGALGTVSEQRDGIYTGRLVGRPMHGEVKAEAVRALAEREGLDLSRCYAYSDSANDIPLLSLVGHPFAINPDGALRAHARMNGWPVRDFRARRKAARVAVPTAAAAAGTLVGAALGATVATRRRA